MSRRHRSSRTDKILFVARRRELWDKPETEIKKALVDAGLVSPSTYILDIRIPDLLKEAKKVDQA